MELWFWFAVLGAVFGGIPSFLLKVATKRNYNSELFILYGAVSSVILLIPFVLIRVGTEPLNLFLVVLSLGAGMIASLGGIFRLYALHAIDTTIYFPLVKLLSPSLAIVAGITFFNESFTNAEWLGLISGVLVPLMLITRHEQGRQKNLILGLILILLTGVLSAIVAALNKYTVDLFDEVLWVLALLSVGVLIGTLLVISYQRGYRNLISHIRTDTHAPLAVWALFRGVIISISFGFVLYAYSFDGPLAIVHTIHSLYILIPIMLSVIFYNEHWNLQKAVAIALSLVALALLE